MVETAEKNKIVSLRFNQDQTCFVCGTEKGFHIYKSVPYQDTFNRQFGGGLGIVEMLYKSNILAMVGGGTNPKFPPNKVMLWDDSQERCIGELSFKTAVKSVKLRKDIFAVVLENRVYVYNFADFQLRDVIDTLPNSKPVCALSITGPPLIASTTKTKGELIIKNYEDNSSQTVRAHETPIFEVAFNYDGRICATASKKGTLIRLFSTKTGKSLQELRRGKDKAEIHSINFDKGSRWLACTSNKGTVHIFSILNSSKEVAVPLDIETEKPLSGSEAKENEVKDPKNPTSAFKFMKKIIPYFKSEWSFAQFRITDTNSLVGFGPEEESSIIVLSSNGKYYKAIFDRKLGGECKKAEEKSITISE